MSDIVLNNAGNANTQIDTEHADVSAGASHEGSAHASENGASYDGSLSGDVSYDTTAPELPDVPDTPELPELPDAAADATATADATVDGATAHADAALSGAVDGGLPELPDVGVPEVPEVPEVDGSVGVEAAWDAMVDVMGDLAAHVSGSLSALFGL